MKAWVVLLLLASSGCAVGGRVGLRFDLRGRHANPGFYGGPALAVPLSGDVASHAYTSAAALFTPSETFGMADFQAGYGASVRHLSATTPHSFGGGINLGVTFGESFGFVGGVCGLYAHEFNADDPKGYAYGLATGCARLSSAGWVGFDVSPYFMVPPIYGD